MSATSYSECSFKILSELRNNFFKSTHEDVRQNWTKGKTPSIVICFSMLFIVEYKKWFFYS